MGSTVASSTSRSANAGSRKVSGAVAAGTISRSATHSASLARPANGRRLTGSEARASSRPWHAL